MTVSDERLRDLQRERVARRRAALTLEERAAKRREADARYREKHRAQRKAADDRRNLAAHVARLSGLTVQETRTRFAGGALFVFDNDHPKGRWVQQPD